MSTKSDHAARLIGDRFGERDGELLLGGVPVTTLAEKHGTPLYAYDRSVIDATFARLRAALPSRFGIYYSIKANPNQQLLRLFLAKGCGLEVASAGEQHQALAAGCPPEQIVFAGPGKTPSELDAALSSGLGEIHVESPLEIERIAEWCERKSGRARIAVRVNPEAEATGGAMRMGGEASPFGIDEEQLESALEQIAARPSLELKGIHLFVGTQILDHTLLLKQYRKGLEIARRVFAATGRALRTVDFGGGYGIPYFPHERELDLDALRAGLEAMLSECEADPAFQGTRFLIEPGRFLVGEAGVYVTRVNDIKVSRSKKFLIVDGGMHHHLAASGNLGQTIKRNYPVAVLNRIGGSDLERVDVVGPLCTPLDVLARNIELAKAAVGDLIGVFQSGAYARTSSPMSFLSHPAPPEIWIENGTDRVIRSRGSLADPLRDQPPAE